MQPTRRDLLKHAGWLTAAGTGALAAGQAAASQGPSLAPDAKGVLVDLDKCIGCRTCEHACRKANDIPPGELQAYDDPSVFRAQRRPTPDAFTVINSYPVAGRAKPVFAKVNCLHCNHPACVSACIVGALKKEPGGPVTYDAWKCIGCRYCMVACPFQIPAYEYDDALTPRVRKCEFCATRGDAGPACAAACPCMVMRWGPRSELLALAHDTIASHPGRYVDKVYGEHEAGGTGWLYLSPVPFEQVGLLPLPAAAPPALTEAIQHGVFKMGIWPALLYGTLGALMWITRPRKSSPKPLPAPVPAPAPAPEPELALAGAPAVGRLAPATPFPLDDQATSPVELPHEPAHREEHSHAHHDEVPAPVRRPFFTPGVFIMLALMGAGLVAGLWRFFAGLGPATNLDQQHPWGLWIAIDVAGGVALAAGGFTSAFLTHVLHRHRYHAIARPALLTAMLGYTFVVIGLQADLGRYYNVWHPLIMWQGNSVLFEVGICVMCYLNVLYLEFAPIACAWLKQQTSRLPRLARLAAWGEKRIDGVMFVLVIAGCCLSCLHQSSLGNLLVIAPSKLHPLWWTPISPLLFLLSAIAVGFPMIIWESLFAGWSLRLKPEMNVLGPLARFVPVTLGLYLAFKIGDMIVRGSYVYLADGSLQSLCWIIEVGAGVLLPLLMLLSARVRRSPGLLFTAATLVVLGVLFNRINVFLIGFRPPFAEKTYLPSLAEFAVTIGLAAALMFVYRVIVTFLPVISQPKDPVPA